MRKREGWGIREAFRRFFAPLTFRRVSALRARVERTLFRIKGPFRTLAQTRECFFHSAITPRPPVRMTQISRRRTNIPARSRVSKLVHKDTCQIFPFHPHSTPFALAVHLLLSEASLHLPTGEHLVWVSFSVSSPTTSALSLLKNIILRPATWNQIFQSSCTCSRSSLFHFVIRYIFVFYCY